MTIVISPYAAMILTVALLVAVSLTITLMGVVASRKFGTRSDGWSDGMALSSLIGMSALTLIVLYRLEAVYNLSVSFGIYAGLVGWYIFLFVFGQRWAVIYTKYQNHKNTFSKQ